MQTLTNDIQDTGSSGGSGDSDSPTAPPRSDCDLMAQVETALVRFDFESATRAEVLLSIDQIAALKARVKELESNHKEALQAWIKYHGDLIVGDTRYYVGTEKHTRCNDNRAAVAAILTACGGDVDSLVSCIASDGLKQGASKIVLGEEEFKRHFSTIVVEDVKTGKPKRKVIAASTRFGKQLEQGNEEV